MGSALSSEGVFVERTVDCMLYPNSRNPRRKKTAGKKGEERKKALCRDGVRVLFLIFITDAYNTTIRSKNKATYISLSGRANTRSLSNVVPGGQHV